MDCRPPTDRDIPGECLDCRFDHQRFSRNRNIGKNAIERSLKFPDIALVALGDVLDDIDRQRSPQLFGLLADDGGAHLVIRQLHIGDQAALKPGTEAIDQSTDLLGRLVAGKHNLLAGLMEGIEGMEELFLGTVLVSDELDVIDHQEIDAPVAIAEVFHPLCPERVDQVIGERFGRDVEDDQARVLREGLVTDRMEQVGFAETDPAPDVERVVLRTKVVGHGGRGGMGKAIG